MIRQNKTILSAFFLGLIFSLYFYNKYTGISYPIFLMMLMAFTMYVIYKEGAFNKSKALLFTIPLFLISFKSFLSTNYIMEFFNNKIASVLFVGIMLLVVKHDLNWGNISFLGKIIAQFFQPIAYVFEPFKNLYNNLEFLKKGMWRSTVVKILIGILISTPFLIIIIALLGSADAVFREMLLFIPNILNSAFGSEKIVNVVSQTILTFTAGTYIYAFVFALLKGQQEIKELEVRENKQRDIDSIILMTILALINSVYIIFCVVQFKYLFGGENSVLPGNLTYAEYARRGFFELMFVTVINFSIILSTIYTSKNKTGKLQRIIKSMLILIGLSTSVMLYSSFFRMSLYQQNYGYTYLRIFVDFFLIFESIALIGTMLYILKQRFNLIKFYIITFLICYTVLNYINIDRVIAKSNIDNYFKTGQIDIEYLKGLSADAIPQMERLVNVQDRDIVDAVKSYFVNKSEALQEKESWFEFNYSRYRAKSVLEKYK